MKRVFALLLAGLLMPGLAACGLPALRPEETTAPPTVSAAPAPENEPGAALTLTVGAEGESDPARLDYALARLGETLPDITVERAASISEAALPDLLLLSDEAAPGYAAAGLLAPLAGEPKAEALLARMTETERSRAFTPEGELFLLPAHGAESWCLFVSDAAFAACGVEAPRSMGELTAALERAHGGAALALCPDEDEAALAFFEGFLSAEDGRGLNALFAGETSPYDESFRLAADKLYRLARAGAVTLTDDENKNALWSSGEAAALFAPEGEAAALGEGAHLLPWRTVFAAAGEGLAVSGACEHRELAVETACLLCEYMAEYDAQTGCGAGLTLPDVPGGDTALSEELAAYRAGLTELPRLRQETAPALAGAVAEGVRELLRGTVTPEEFQEIAAMALDARP